MYSKNEPLYPVTVHQLRVHLERRLSEIEEEAVELRDSLRCLAELEQVTKVKLCPFCGGQMFDLAPILDLPSGDCRGSLPTSGHVKMQFGPRPHQWECQTCLIFNFPPPYADRCDSKWVREDKWPGANSVAGALFRHYDRTKKVALETEGLEYIWHVQMDDGCWYRFTGRDKKAAFAKLNLF